MDAEQHYLFQHSIFRESVYESLDLPERGRLHKVALDLFEDWTKRFQRPAYARELARHAAEAARAENTERQIRQREALATAELRYLQVAAEDADKTHMLQDAVRLWRQVAQHPKVAPEQHITAMLREAEALRCCGRAKDAEQRLMELRSLRPQGPERTKVAISLANALRVLGLKGDAEHEAAYALDVATDDYTRAEAQYCLGCIARDSGRMEEAASRLQEAVDLHRKRGAELAAVKVEGAKAQLLAVTGRLAEAEVVYRKVMEAHIAVNDPRGEAIYASNLAAVLRELGRREESVSCCLRARELHRAQGSRADEAIAHGNLATVQRELGLLQEAELSFRRALHILRDHENRIMEGLFLVNMGNLLDDTGRTVHAIDCYEHAIMWFRRGGVRGQLGLALGNLGVARKKLGRLDDGLAALTEAIQLLEAHKSLHIAGAFAALRGEFRLLLGDVYGARADLALAEKLLPVPNALVLHRRHVLPLRARLLAHEGKAPELRALVDAFRAEVGNVAPASEDGEELHRLTALVEGLQAGTLFNGHTTSEMTRELRRALAQREGQPEPLRERLLAAGV